jgi:CBS domain-containing protein
VKIRQLPRARPSGLVHSRQQRARAAFRKGTSLAPVGRPTTIQEIAMQARDIMSKNPRTVTPDLTVREAARLMKEADVGVLPVVEAQGSDSRLVGMVTDRDIAVRLVAEGRQGDEARVRDIMSGNPKTVRDNANVDDVLELMGREQVRRLPVVDERGIIIGIIAQADLSREAPDERKFEDTIEQISQPGGRHSQ